VITVKYVDTIDEIKGFTVYNGTYSIIINSNLSASEKTKAYLVELSNIESGKYGNKLNHYKEKVI